VTTDVLNVCKNLPPITEKSYVDGLAVAHGLEVKGTSGNKAKYYQHHVA